MLPPVAYSITPRRVHHGAPCIDFIFLKKAMPSARNDPPLSELEAVDALLHARLKPHV